MTKELLAPNGKPSNLTPEQYELVRTLAFINWFGDWENDPANASKILDSNGEPLVVYHGTTEDFTVFLGGSYFTDDYMNADGYASGEIVLETFLNIKKPLVINARGRKWDDLKNKYGTSTREIVASIDESRYDGVIFNNINDNWFDDENGEAQNVYFTINPNQIKLADVTNTTFDESNDDIRYTIGGEVNADGFIIEELDKDLKEVYQNRAFKNIGGSDFYFSRLNIYPQQNVFTIELPSGEEIGRATLNEKENYLTNIRVNENYRRKGLAINLYDFIEYVIGEKLKPSPDKISKEAEKLWIKRNADIQFFDGGSILLAPNGKPSNLNSEQYKLVRTNEFKKWFGDWENDPANASKVVDDNGEPEVCYHGTFSKNLNLFDEKKIGDNTGNEGHYGYGFYFSYDKIEASTYTYDTNPIILECFLNIRNPFLSSNLEYLERYSNRYGYYEEKKPVAIDSNWLESELKKQKDKKPYLLYKSIKENGYEKGWELFLDKNKMDWDNETFDYNRINDWYEYDSSLEQFSKENEDENYNDEIPEYILENISEQLNVPLSEIKTIKQYTVGNYPSLLYMTDLGYRSRNLTDEIKQDGFDGIIAGSEIVLFKSNQIKLADGTNTTFDSNSDDIRFAQGGRFFNDKELLAKWKKGKSIGFTGIAHLKSKGLIPRADGLKRKSGKYMENGGSTLLAPNGKPSNLTPKQYELVRTPAFKSWFGDWQNDPDNASKVVDENGEPLVVYHGTSAKFNVFRDTNVKRSTMGNSVGFYFTPSEWNASRRSAMGDYIKVFLNIKNIVYLKKFSSDYDFLAILGEELKLAKGLPERAETYWFLKNGSAYRGREDDNVGDVVKALSLKKGIDGYYFTEFMSKEEGVVPVYVVFNSQNVKLADGTNTTFDSSNDDIRYAQGGGLDDLKIFSKREEIISYLTKNSGRWYQRDFDELNELFDSKTYVEQDDEVVKEISEQYLNFYKKNPTFKKIPLIIYQSTAHKDFGEGELFRYDFVNDVVISSSKKEYYEFKNTKTIPINDICGFVAEKYTNKIYGVLMHEFGHYVNISNAGYISDDWFNSNYEQIVKNISIYAGEKKSEFLAEVFALKNIPNFEELDEEKKEFIRENYDKVLRGKLKFEKGGEINEEAQQLIDIISMNPQLEKYQKYKVILKDKFGIDFNLIYKDQEYIDSATLSDIKSKDDFFDFGNWLQYAKIISTKRGFVPMDSYWGRSDEMTDENWNETANKLGFIVEKYKYEETGNNSGDVAYAFGDKLFYTKEADLYYFLHEIGHIYDFQNELTGIIKNPAYSPTNYGTTHSGETFAENFAIYFLNPTALKNWNEDVYYAMDSAINDKYKKELKKIVSEKSKFGQGGGVFGKPTEFYERTYADGTTQKFSIEDYENNVYPYLEKGGRTIAQTPAPKKDQVYGSSVNKSKSSTSLASGKLIKFDEKTLEAIKSKVSEHNKSYPNKKISLASAKAVVRRGLGAYSSSHRPTISGGKPNSRVAWGLARLNAFIYKIVNGKSESGKYKQDDDLIEELGYEVENYKNGGEMKKDIRCINCGWEWDKKDSEAFDMYVCHKCGFDNTTFYTSDIINKMVNGGKVGGGSSSSPDYLRMFLGK
jgi:hypothetical protein